jgi:hypothetical protein
MRVGATQSPRSGRPRRPPPPGKRNLRKSQRSNCRLHCTRLVAAARLQNALGTEPGLGDPAPANEIQHEILEDLGSSDEADPLPADRREADAWIECLRLKARCRALERLQIEAGDIVKVESSDYDRLEEVSSIGNDGRVYFKGGLGGRAWPDVVTVRARKEARGSLSHPGVPRDHRVPSDTDDPGVTRLDLPLERWYFIGGVVESEENGPAFWFRALDNGITFRFSSGDRQSVHALMRRAWDIPDIRTACDALALEYGDL